MRRQFLRILMLEHTQHSEPRFVVIIVVMIRRVNLRTFLFVILHILNELQSILIHKRSALRYRIGETFIRIENFLLIFVFEKINLSLNLISSELEIPLIVAILPLEVAIKINNLFFHLHNTILNHNYNDLKILQTDILKSFLISENMIQRLLQEHTLLTVHCHTHKHLQSLVLFRLRLRVVAEETIIRIKIS